MFHHTSAFLLPRPFSNKGESLFHPKNNYFLSFFVCIERFWKDDFPSYVSDKMRVSSVQLVSSYFFLRRLQLIPVKRCVGLLIIFLLIHRMLEIQKLLFATPGSLLLYHN